MAPAAPKPVKRHTVSRRINARRQKRLDAMGDRIHAGRRGHGAGQSQCQFGVANCSFGNEKRACKSQLASVIHNNHKTNGNLAPGAGRGGHGQQRGYSLDELAAAGQRVILCEWAAAAGKQSNRLTEIHGGAATDCQNTVASVCRILLEGLRYRCFGRVSGGFVENRYRQISFKRIGYLVDQPGSSDARIRGNEHSCDAGLVQFGGEVLDGSKVEMRCCEVCQRSHGGFNYP